MPDKLYVLTQFEICGRHNRGDCPVQTLIAGTGLAIASTPGALLLTATILFLCLAQLGPALVMIPAVIWEFHSGSGVAEGIFLVFALVSMTIDNFIRPI